MAAAHRPHHHSQQSLRSALLDPPPTTTTPNNNNHIYVLDGGVSTHLEELGGRGGGGTDAHHPFEHRELWSSSDLLSAQGRNYIRQGHDDWIHAGANLISTVTYQCHYEESLWPSSNNNNNNNNNLHMTHEIMDEMIHTAIQLARQAVTNCVDDVDDDPKTKTNNNNQRQPTWVVLSSGCYGSALANGAEYTGDYQHVTKSQLYEFHRRKLQRIPQLVHDDDGPDAVAVETIPSLLETQALADLLVEQSHLLTSTNTACWISFACHNGSELNDGNSLQSALDVIRNVPVETLQGIGINCCDSQHVESLTTIIVQDMLQHNPNSPRRRRAILLYPNSGETWDATHQCWRCDASSGKSNGNSSSTSDPATAFVEGLMQVVQNVQKMWKQQHDVRGSDAPPPPPVMVVGGCCRTRPETIVALRTAVDKMLAGGLTSTP